MKKEQRHYYYFIYFFTYFCFSRITGWAITVPDNKKLKILEATSYKYSISV